MSQNSKRIRPYSSSRSSKVIDLGVNGKPIREFLLVINIVTLAVSATVSRYSRLKIENCWFYSPLPCLTLPLGGNPLEFLDETYSAKTRGMGLPYGENFIILTLTVFLWYTRVTDWQRDRRSIAYSALSICCRAPKSIWRFHCYEHSGCLAVVVMIDQLGN